MAKKKKDIIIIDKKVEGLKIRIEKKDTEEYKEKFNNFIDTLKNISKHSEVLTKKDIINSIENLIYKAEGTKKIIVLDDNGIEIIKIKE